MTNKLKKRLMKFNGGWNFLSSFLLLRYSSWNTRRLEGGLRKISVGKLHVGCGDIVLPDWVNIRFERREEYGAVKRRSGGFYLNYNLLQRWPWPDGSIEYIAGSHFIEHLDLNQGMKFLGEAFRVMKKGGVIRLSCPDMEIYARHYVAGNKNFFEHPLIREWCAFKKAATPGEIFIAKAYDSGGSHRWFYDFASLKHVLEEAGFRQVTREERLTGKVPDLEKIEPPKRELETLYVEAVKE